MICNMGLIGVTKTSQITHNYVTEAEPVTDPHEMSGWVNMPLARL